MGLAGVKRKHNFGLDPNNTKWARNTDSFGQRMLRSQGWEPGQYLGAKDAPHALLHTAANASHIRVFMREDNQGIGAKRGRDDECTGLDAFADLLGRLNGKDETVLEAERKVREDRKIKVYIQRKLGSMRFVAGGLLVGDQVRELALPGETSVESEAQLQKTSQKDKKRRRTAKVEGALLAGVDGGESQKRKAKRRRQDKDSSTVVATSQPVASAQPGDLIPAARDSVEVSQDLSLRRDGNHEAVPSAKSNELKSSSSSDSESRKRARKEKRERKQRRRETKEKVVAQAADMPKEKAIGTVVETRDGVTHQITSSGSSTPTGRLPIRHVARRKFIAQKQMSVLDPQALKQIFMIKSSSS